LFREESNTGSTCVTRDETRVEKYQVIDGARNTVYDIFSATDEEFALIFPPGEDIAFIEEVYERTAPNRQQVLAASFTAIWGRRIAKRDAMGIHGILFCQLEHKKQYIRHGATRKP
jgi:hypothetical protein